MKPLRVVVSHFPVILSCASLMILLAMNPPIHADESSLALTKERASAFARLALRGLTEEYPNKPEHVMDGPGDVKAPPACTRRSTAASTGTRRSTATGCWCGCCGCSPTCRSGRQIRAVLAEHLTAKNLQAEADYFARKDSKSFERTYGWAWLLKLAEELHGWDDPDARQWSQNLQPLADAIVARYLDFLPKQTYPIRTGVHPEHGVRAGVRPRLRAGRRQHAAARADRGAQPGLLRRGRRRPGRLGAGRGGLLLAEPDGGRPDAARAAAGRVPRPGSRGSCRARPRASRRRCSSRRR